METDDPIIHVTPWSKTPSKTYEPVDVDLVAAPAVQEVMMLLTKKNGFSMAVTFKLEAIAYIAKDFAEVARRFKKESN